MGRRAVAVPADVTKDTEVDKMVETAVRELGGIDILVNNVGHGLPILVEDMTTAEWHEVMLRNLYAPFFCSRAVIPIMKKRGGGKIINIGSMAGKRICPLTGASYAAAKAGLLGLTRQLAAELGPYNINVNAVCPAGVASNFKLTPPEEMYRHFEEGGHSFNRKFGPLPPEELEKTIHLYPIRKVTMSEDIGNAVVFLASERSRTITGISLDVDGGAYVSVGDWESYVKRRKEWVAENRKVKQ
jgi:NAD(P)-dependent dehydrogenase (short-subunit alcohol dehydrogenase family)